MSRPASDPRPAIYHRAGEIIHADTCDRLKAAAARGELRLAGFGRRGYPGRRLPAGVLPGVASVGFWDNPRFQSWGLDWHRNEGIEITCLTGGRLDFAVDGREYPLAAGDLTITRPWQEHAVGRPGLRASRLVWLILDLRVRRPNQTWQWPDWLLFSPADLARLTELLRHCERPVWKATPGLRNSFEQLARRLAAGGAAPPETALKIELNALLLELLHMLRARRIPLRPELSSTRRMVELFLQHLPESPGHPWTLASMAEHCGLGRSRFAHYCAELTNLSPARYLLRCRLEAAVRRLRHHPEQTITQIALDCGFGSSQYFANVFRRAYGVSAMTMRRGSA